MSSTLQLQTTVPLFSNTVSSRSEWISVCVCVSVCACACVRYRERRRNSDVCVSGVVFWHLQGYCVQGSAALPYWSRRALIGLVFFRRDHPLPGTCDRGVPFQRVEIVFLS